MTWTREVMLLLAQLYLIQEAQGLARAKIISVPSDHNRGQDIVAEENHEGIQLEALQLGSSAEDYPIPETKVDLFPPRSDRRGTNSRRPYVPFNSLTLSTSNGNRDWSDSETMKKKVESSKLAGVTRPSEIPPEIKSSGTDTESHLSLPEISSAASSKSTPGPAQIARNPQRETDRLSVTEHGGVDVIGRKPIFPGIHYNKRRPITTEVRPSPPAFRPMTTGYHPYAATTTLRTTTSKKTSGSYTRIPLVTQKQQFTYRPFVWRKPITTTTRRPSITTRPETEPSLVSVSSVTTSWYEKGKPQTDSTDVFGFSGLTQTAIDLKTAYLEDGGSTSNRPVSPGLDQKMSDSITKLASQLSQISTPSRHPVSESVIKGSTESAAHLPYESVSHVETPGEAGLSALPQTNSKQPVHELHFPTSTRTTPISRIPTNSDIFWLFTTEQYSTGGNMRSTPTPFSSSTNPTPPTTIVKTTKPYINLWATRRTTAAKVPPGLTPTDPPQQPQNLMPASGHGATISRRPALRPLVTQSVLERYSTESVTEPSTSVSKPLPAPSPPVANIDYSLQFQEAEDSSSDYNDYFDYSDSDDLSDSQAVTPVSELFLPAVTQKPSSDIFPQRDKRPQDLSNDKESHFHDGYVHQENNEHTRVRPQYQQTQEHQAIGIPQHHLSLHQEYFNQQNDHSSQQFTHPPEEVGHHVHYEHPERPYSDTKRHGTSDHQYNPYDPHKHHYNKDRYSHIHHEEHSSQQGVHTKVEKRYVLLNVWHYVDGELQLNSSQRIESSSLSDGFKTLSTKGFVVVASGEDKLQATPNVVNVIIGTSLPPGLSPEEAFAAKVTPPVESTTSSYLEYETPVVSATLSLRPAEQVVQHSNFQGSQSHEQKLPDFSELSHLYPYHDSGQDAEVPSALTLLEFLQQFGYSNSHREESPQSFLKPDTYPEVSEEIGSDSQGNLHTYPFHPSWPTSWPSKDHEHLDLLSESSKTLSLLQKGTPDPEDLNTERDSPYTLPQGFASKTANIGHDFSFDLDEVRHNVGDSYSIANLQGDEEKRYAQSPQKNFPQALHSVQEGPSPVSFGSAPPYQTKRPLNTKGEHLTSNGDHLNLPSISLGIPHTSEQSFTLYAHLASLLDSLNLHGQYIYSHKPSHQSSSQQHSAPDTSHIHYDTQKYSLHDHSLTPGPGKDFSKSRLQLRIPSGATSYNFSPSQAASHPTTLTKDRLYSSSYPGYDSMHTQTGVTGENSNPSLSIFHTSNTHSPETLNHFVSQKGQQHEIHFPVDKPKPQSDLRPHLTTSLRPSVGTSSGTSGGIKNPSLIGVPSPGSPAVGNSEQIFGGVGNSDLSNHPVSSGGNSGNNFGGSFGTQNDHNLLQTMTEPQALTDKSSNDMNKPPLIPATTGIDRILSKLQDLEGLDNVLEYVDTGDPEISELLQSLALQSLLPSSPDLNLKPGELINANESSPPVLPNHTVNDFKENGQQNSTHETANQASASGITPHLGEDAFFDLYALLVQNDPLSINQEGEVPGVPAGNVKQSNTSLSSSDHSNPGLPDPVFSFGPDDTFDDAFLSQGILGLSPTTLSTPVLIPETSNVVSPKPSAGTASNARGCLQNRWCALGLAIAMGFGATGALAAPFVVPVFGRRRRRLVYPLEDQSNGASSSDYSKLETDDTSMIQTILSVDHALADQFQQHLVNTTAYNRGESSRNLTSESTAYEEDSPLVPGTRERNNGEFEPVKGAPITTASKSTSHMIETSRHISYDARHADVGSVYGNKHLAYSILSGSSNSKAPHGAQIVHPPLMNYNSAKALVESLDKTNTLPPDQSRGEISGSQANVSSIPQLAPGLSQEALTILKTVCEVVREENVPQNNVTDFIRDRCSIFFTLGIF